MRGLPFNAAAVSVENWLAGCDVWISTIICNDKEKRSGDAVVKLADKLSLERALRRQKTDEFDGRYVYIEEIGEEEFKKHRFNRKNQTHSRFLHFCD